MNPPLGFSSTFSNSRDKETLLLSRVSSSTRVSPPPPSHPGAPQRSALSATSPSCEHSCLQGRRRRQAFPSLSELCSGRPTLRTSARTFHRQIESQVLHPCVLGHKPGSQPGPHSSGPNEPDSFLKMQPASQSLPVLTSQTHQSNCYLTFTDSRETEDHFVY